MNVFNVMIAALLSLIIGSLVYLYLISHQERNALSEEIRKLHKRIDKILSDSSTNRSLVKRMDSLEASFANLKMQSGVASTHFSEKQIQKEAKPVISETATTSDDMITIKPNVQEIETDTRIWVKKTIGGLMTLDKSERPTDIYLSRQNEKFTLHIVKLVPSNINNISILYGDILDIPVGFDSITSIEMEKYPVYEEQNSSYINISRGKLKINP